MGDSCEESCGGMWAMKHSLKQSGARLGVKGSAGSRSEPTRAALPSVALHNHTGGGSTAESLQHCGKVEVGRKHLA